MSKQPFGETTGGCLFLVLIGIALVLLALAFADSLRQSEPCECPKPPIPAEVRP